MTKYPLEQVLDVKKDRVEKAEKNVKEKKRALEIEEEKLKKVQEERDKVLKHHNDKLAQLRKTLDEGTTSPEIQQMKAYLKVVKERLKREEDKVKKQQEQVKIAEKNLEEARKDLQRKRVEVEKIQAHKTHWEHDMKKEIERKETQEHDEVGTTVYEAHKRRKGGKT